ncbi:MAG: dihydrodipicolinate synthase family protein, partial [Candidatus Dormiibacterota bacterium]
MAPQLYPAMLTPLIEGGEAIDETVLGPEVDFLLGHGADGVFIAGSTGEGVNLGLDERRQLLRATQRALAGRGRLLVHVGAQTTRATVALASDAAAQGVDGVAVIPPPYFPLDDRELAQHLITAAAAAAPTPFYIYCFAARSGYRVSVGVVERVREAAPNLAGLKLSDAPWSAVEGYFELGVPVFVGNEPLIADAAGKSTFAGSVSALASVYPEATRALVDDPTPERAAAVARLRAGLSEGAALLTVAKAVLRSRGVPINPDVRLPARTIGADEAAAAVRRVADALQEATA